MHPGSKRRLWAGLVLAVAAGALVVAVVVMHAHGVVASITVPKESLAQDGMRTTGAEAVAVKPAHESQPARLPRAADLPAGDVPLRAAVATLLPLANAGRADAMRDLALRLMSCSGQTNEDEAALRKDRLRRFYWDYGHEPSTDAEIAQVASLINADSRKRDDCAGVDAVVISQRAEWLEKAARAGDSEALLDYSGWALTGMGREDILKDLAEVERRRTLAGNFLNEALARGDCDALWRLAQAYSGETGPMDWIYPPDLNQAYAYAVANLQWVARQGGSTEVAQARVDRFGAELSGAQQAALSRQGNLLLQSRCSD